MCVYVCGEGGGGGDAERILRFYKHNVELSLQCKTSFDIVNVINPKLANFEKTPQKPLYSFDILLKLSY